MCYFDALYDEQCCNYHPTSNNIHQNKSRKGHFGVVPDLLHEYNLIYPHVKQVKLFIYIKDVLFFPLRPQYLPNIFDCPNILDFCLFLLHERQKVKGGNFDLMLA